MGGGGTATGGVGGNPTKGMRGGGGNRRSRRESVVDGSRKEMAYRVERHEADKEVQHIYAYLCYSRRQLVHRAGSNVVFLSSSYFFLFLALDPL